MLNRSGHRLFFDQPAESVEDTAPDSAIIEYEQELARMRDALAENLPENREDWSPDDTLFHLAGLLLDFYRRADKPVWLIWRCKSKKVEKIAIHFFCKWYLHLLKKF